MVRGTIDSIRFGWGAYRPADSIDISAHPTHCRSRALRRPRPCAEPSIPHSDGAIELAPGNAVVLYNDLNSRRDFAMTRFPRPNAVAMESLVWLFSIVTVFLTTRYLFQMNSSAIFW